MPAEITPATISSIMIPMPPCTLRSNQRIGHGFHISEDTENHKPGGDPLPVIGRQRHERDPHTNKFVPDNAAVIVHAHVFRRLMTKIDADTDPQHHHQRIELPWQKGHQIPERNRRQRSHRARTIGLNPLPNPTASRCHGLLIFRRLFATSLWRGKMVISFPV